MTLEGPRAAGTTPTACQVKDVDRYGRKVALCRLRGDDLKGWMLR